MEVLGASAFHVSQSGVALVSRFGVLAGAASVIFVEITAVGPAVVGVVVSSLGARRALASVITALLLCWGRGLCGECLCNGLVDDCGDIRRRRGHTRVHYDAREGCCVGDCWGVRQEAVLHALNEERQLVVFGLRCSTEGCQLGVDGINFTGSDSTVGDSRVVEGCLVVLVVEEFLREELFEF